MSENACGDSRTWNFETGSYRAQENTESLPLTCCVTIPSLSFFPCNVGS